MRLSSDLADYFSVAAVIPAYKASKTILKVVEATLPYVDAVFVVDDACPESTGKVVEEYYFKPTDNVYVLRNIINLGVGGATVKGFIEAMKGNYNLLIKLDADGQMDSSLIPLFVEKINIDGADLVKGNRFFSVRSMLSMPIVRLAGNIVLSFLAKLSTGYWELFDPTNGFIAVKTDALRLIPFEQASKRYFFETDILFLCGLQNLRVLQVSMKPMYDDHFSSMNPILEVPNFFFRHLLLFFRRILYEYVLLDFNVGSISLLAFALNLFVFLGISFWRLSIGTLSYETAPGILSIFVISAIVGSQCLLNFLYFDSTQRPLLRKFTFTGHDRSHKQNS